MMRENRVRLMDAMNQINQRYGRSSLKLASAEVHRARKLWAMKQKRISSGFTTDWVGLAKSSKSSRLTIASILINQVVT